MAMTLTTITRMTPEQLGAAAGAATGIFGPLRQYETEGAPQYYWDGLLQTWVMGWIIADAVMLLGWGFGALGVDWLIGALVGTITHIVVSYVMGFIIEWATT